MSLIKFKKTAYISLIGLSTFLGLWASTPTYAYSDYYYHHYYYHERYDSGDVAAAGIFGAVIGGLAGAAIASSYNRDGYYERRCMMTRRYRSCHYNYYGDRVCRVQVVRYDAC